MNDNDMNFELDLDTMSGEEDNALEILKENTKQDSDLNKLPTVVGYDENGIKE